MKYLNLIAAFLLSTACFAQQPNVTWLTAEWKITTIRDSAFFIRTISAPEPGSNMYSYTENFATGEPFMAGKTSKSDVIQNDSGYTMFYPSGGKLCEVDMDQHKLKKETIYYPNGVLYLVKEYTPGGLLISTCNDSTGRQLIINGNGHFISYTPKMEGKFSTISSYQNFFDLSDEEGSIRNGKKDGIWKSTDLVSKNEYSYNEEYKDGSLVKGQSIDKNGQRYSYTQKWILPSFPGGPEALSNFLLSNIAYPENDRKLGIEGRIYLDIVVEKDGTMSGIKAIKPVSDEMGKEAIRVIQLIPGWIPATQNGIPVRQEFVMPINFSLTKK